MEINEKVFQEHLDNKAITQIKIILNEEGKYNLLLSLNWKKGEEKLLTARGEWRSWVSLDRLIRHLKSKTKQLPPISLIIPDRNKKEG